METTALAYSQQQSALTPDMFDQIERKFEQMKDTNIEESKISIMS